MKDIQNVAILGAGAMGAYFASRFFDTSGFSTGLIAKGHRFDRLKNNGLVVNGKPYAIPVIHQIVSNSQVSISAKKRNVRFSPKKE